MMEFTNKVDIMIFYANAIDSTGEDGGQICGCSVHFLFWGEDGTAMVGQSEPDVSKALGMQRGKAWLDVSIRNKIRIAPAIYEGTFTMAVGSDGKPILKLIDVAYKCNVEMRPYKLKGLEIPGMVPYDEVEVKDYNDILAERREAEAMAETKPEKAESKPENKK